MTKFSRNNAKCNHQIVEAGDRDFCAVGEKAQSEKEVAGLQDEVNNALCSIPGGFCQVFGKDNWSLIKRCLMN